MLKVLLDKIADVRFVPRVQRMLTFFRNDTQMNHCTLIDRHVQLRGSFEGKRQWTYRRRMQGHLEVGSNVTAGGLTVRFSPA